MLAFEAGKEVMETLRQKQAGVASILEMLLTEMGTFPLATSHCISNSSSCVLSQWSHITGGSYRSVEGLEHAVTSMTR